ncbi:multifunctional CCA tRNA nucleotidyl transferase/2'3'-cyclic phosphodiesterase/2'nucleotidase/phosphatase [Sansalvadorimonas verongulae]|uniref:multifunctional CCA tRNA nucleotidyl transferase/2'3'-cyclic phosphodiesterase/2'nucleotidase/phosphatase n=1 Tax=Sansalvadorimonas verongulae TaxID=2172824 RepID=UPI0012BD6EDF|nr:multifunctional CCA tRNA nucleotidyl transferase/2'3'-cyclic phosphodiesterase/2'nucleotidase/phosphatase [Sansalvadorimonas verongulae]MTI15619.1 multifunctional CCA tRNA nucleotidyl transferase/2'3'-cyclic phosphodiesterase/2'nucleotidase/phosphatase [Sansalvadorimonas verongulae]
MKTYLVGGAVRDELLGLPVKDRDWVVTGATPDDMLKAGYKPVGLDFPVFLHPKTKEEYALARTERKSGHGYAGFVFHTSPDITVEEDLLRRDLTINAIAKDENDNLVDPYHGQKDLTNRILRHVSPAFREDPLRILRVARFAARFAEQGFTVAEETRQLMQKMVQEGEASWLVAERVWQETIRALESTAPVIYFQELESCGALNVVMPELAVSFNEQALSLATQKNCDVTVRFACSLCSTDSTSLKSVKALCKRMKVPSQYREVAEVTARILPQWFKGDITPELRLKLLQQTDGFRRPERFQQILTACHIFSEVSGGNRKLSTQLTADLEKCKAVDVQALIAQGLKGKELAEGIQQARLEAIQ